MALVFAILCGNALTMPAMANDAAARVAVLVYHRFGQTPADSMTVRVQTFEAQLRMLRALGYRFVPLHDVVAWLEDERAGLPPKAIALTWDQLRALQATGLFDVQSHTYWHPNFDIERARLPHEAFEAFATMQLQKSRASLEAHLQTHVDLLAWPFGIVDDELVQWARSAGYHAAFELGGRTIDRDSPRFKLSRLLVVDSDTPLVLARLLGEPADAYQHNNPLPEKQP